MSLEQLMTKEESYVQRRQLFKNIWEAALDLTAKEDILKKPKVIKTLRMDEIDRCPIGKTKNERIRNLRHVCNKILDFCNRQDADDMFYQKIAAAGHANKGKESPESPTKLKRAKVRVKRKFKKAKSAPHNEQTFQPNVITVARLEQKIKEEKNNEEDLVSVASSSSSSELSTKPKKKKIRRKVRKLKTKKSVKSDDVPKDKTASETVTKRKVLKRKGHVKKHTSASSKATPQIISV